MVTKFYQFKLKKNQKIKKKKHQKKKKKKKKKKPCPKLTKKPLILVIEFVFFSLALILVLDWSGLE